MALLLVGMISRFDYGIDPGLCFEVYSLGLEICSLGLANTVLFSITVCKYLPTGPSQSLPVSVLTAFALRPVAPVSPVAPVGPIAP